MQPVLNTADIRRRTELARGHEPRIIELEKQVAELRQMIQAITLQNVEGNLTLQFNDSAIDLAVTTGDVGGDVEVNIDGHVTSLNVNTGDVNDDVEIENSGSVVGIEVTTGDVAGSIVSESGEAAEEPETPAADEDPSSEES